MEQWASIPGWDMYEVSDQGRLRRNGRIYRHWMLGTRPVVQLRDKPRKLRTYISRLMLMAFIRTPKPGEEARHLDDNPSNNVLSNLEWGSRHDNINDLIRNGRGRKGVRHPLARLTEAQVLEIRDSFIPYKVTAKEVAVRFNISAKQVRQIVSRSRWSHL